ncbi:MAG: hypothetical protein IT292_07730 [Deltaproteobacteria bacterium]|nr:hypothetical protein [Deltaproteobacteria bacterium]
MGVDSFYTFLKLREHEASKPDYLICAYCFDIKLSNIDLYQSVKARLEVVGKESDIKIIHLKTNLRPFGDICLRWGEDFHGAALASIGLALGSTFSKIYIPVTCTYEVISPWVSHLLTDPLWSSETL